MKTISFKEIVEIEDLKEQARLIYEEIDNKVEKLFKKYGESEAVYEIEPDDQGNKVLRFRLVDNVKKLREGSIFRTTSVKAVDCEIKRLKRAA